MLEEGATFCGFVAIVGRPNVGKSTFLNHILGEKVSITSRKPQTTRHRLLGVKTLGLAQIVYVDTPGMHIGRKRALNQFMNKEARLALIDVDVVIFMVESLKWTEEDQLVLDVLIKAKCPVILAVNKADSVHEKTALFPYLQKLSEKFNFSDIIPVSAKRGTNLETLEQKVISYLPQSPHYFPENQITDKPVPFRIAEIIREKIIRSLGEELPYTTTVEIEAYQPDKVTLISAIIWVEREGQKPIIIGKAGERIKEIGRRARLDIEKLLHNRVHLKLWVKIRDGWSDDKKALQNLGYIDTSDL